jgi:hypothetical protein
LVAATATGRGHADKFCGRGGAIGGGRGKLVLDDGFDVIDTYEDVLRFEIGVNDATTAVHVVQAEEDLFSDLAY